MVWEVDTGSHNRYWLSRTTVAFILWRGDTVQPPRGGEWVVWVGGERGWVVKKHSIWLMMIHMSRNTTWYGSPGSNDGKGNSIRLMFQG